MSNLARRSSRRELEKRAYNLTLATTGAGLATIAIVVLALFDVTSFGLAFLLALVTAGLAYALKRTLRA